MKTNLKLKIKFKAQIALLMLSSIVAYSASYKIVADSRIHAMVEQNSAPDSELHKQMAVDRLRLDNVARWEQGLTVRLRFRFDKTLDSRALDNGWEGSGPGLDFFYADQKVTDWFTLRLGKFLPYTQGYELRGVIPDTYIFPLAMTKTKPGTARFNLQPVNPSTGVQARFQFARQKLNVWTANSGFADSRDSSAQRYLSGGLTWLGSFADKSLQPGFSFAWEPKSGEHGSWGSRSLGAHMRWVGQKMWINAGYAEIRDRLWDSQNYVQSIVLSAQMSQGEWRPVFSLLGDHLSSEVDYAGMSAGLFWYPWEDLDFRYALVWTGRADISDGVVNGITGASLKQQIFAGVRGKMTMFQSKSSKGN